MTVSLRNTPVTSLRALYPIEWPSMHNCFGGLQSRPVVQFHPGKIHNYPTTYCNGCNINAALYFLESLLVCYTTVCIR